MKVSVLCLIIAGMNFGAVMSAKILIVMPMPWTSHTRTYMPLFKELALRGHNITFYTAYPYKEEIPNMKTIVLNDFFGEIVKPILSGLDDDSLNGWRHVLFVWRIGQLALDSALSQPPIKELIHSTDLSFDLILLETFFTHEPLIALGHKFNAPVINLHPFRAENWINFNLGNPNPFSYVPDFRLEVTEYMNFYGRLSNMIIGMFQRITGHLYYLPRQEEIMRKHFNYPGSENIPPLTTMLKNTSLSLLDGHYVVGAIAPTLLNFVHVGGIHITQKNKTLPKDLQKWIEDSPDGIIYMSLGSMFRSADLKPKHIDVLNKVFSSLPQRILWKWEDGEIPGQPSNVKTSKWFPQLDILAHPKCRLFLTHGGFHSVFEAVYYGVPIVGTPLISDQKGNLHNSEGKGFGLMVKFSNLSEESLSTAINRVLNEPSFRENAQKWSQIIKDEPLTPMERGVFWIEHVLRHKGASHLKTARLSLSWYEYLLLDVVAVIAITIFAIIVILYYTIKSIFKLFTSFSKDTQIKSKTKKREKDSKKTN